MASLFPEKPLFLTACRLLKFIVLRATHGLEFFRVVSFHVQHWQGVRSAAKTHVRIVALSLSGVGKGTLGGRLGPASRSVHLSLKHGGAEQQYKQRFHEVRAKEVKTRC